MQKKTIIILLLIIETLFLIQHIRGEIIDKKMSVGYRTAQSRNIDVVIIHSVYNNSGGEIFDIDLIIKQFARYNVSAHYLIGRAGEIYKLVDEKNVAYHAGKSILPDGRTSVNSCSIGIEVVCSLQDSVNEAQTTALLKLTNDIKNRYKIKYILRHSDIAPGRKTDPWNFDWENFNSRLKTAN